MGSRLLGPVARVGGRLYSSMVRGQQKIVVTDRWVVGKPLYQARKSSLFPLCLHPVQFMHKM